MLFPYNNHHSYLVLHHYQLHQVNVIVLMMVLDQLYVQLHLHNYHTTSKGNLHRLSMTLKIRKNLCMRGSSRRVVLVRPMMIHSPY